VFWTGRLSLRYGGIEARTGCVMRIKTAVFAVSAAVAALCLPTALSAAKSPYDGPWAVTIMTESGTCDPAYRYAVVVAGGQVTSDARESAGVVTISGKVDGTGNVKVSVSRGEQQANASGKLSPNGGVGTWAGKSSSTTCAGRWEARRN
jgi:hypothetical protein